MQRYRTTISVDELRRGMVQPDWCIVDSRFELKAPEKGRQEYLSGHIPGAVYAHLDRDLADPVRADSGR
ncbi:MAG: sulfurtransferase, partial [Gammaproteobacteria bacterium]|nr:sulfurtransferase [Gammaproteobacteria bacterium]